MGSQVRSVSSGRECGSHETGETLIRYDAYQMTDRIGGLSDSNRTSYGIPRGILKGPPWFPLPPHGSQSLLRPHLLHHLPRDPRGRHHHLRSTRSR